jgi:hypothetical protein
VLRGRKNMGKRFLYNGIENDISRGEWTAILGLFEDLYRCCDNASPRDVKVDDRIIEVPYIGRKNEIWPPKISHSKINNRGMQNDDYYSDYTADGTNLNIYSNLPSNITTNKEDNSNNDKLMKLLNIDVPKSQLACSIALNDANEMLRFANADIIHDPYRFQSTNTKVGHALNSGII